MNYPPYQGRPQPAPAKSSSGAKTCLILGLSGVALLGLLMIVGVVGLIMLGRSVAKSQEQARNNQMARMGIRPPTVQPAAPRIKIEDIKPPTSVNEAIAMLNREEWEYHEVAAKWLKNQPLDVAQQSRVSGELVKKTQAGPTSARNAAFDAYEKWAHPDSAGDFAQHLRPGQDGNARRLRILTKLKRLESAEKIAELLESSADGPEAVVALKAIGQEAVPYILPMVSSPKPLAAKNAKELLEHFNVNVDEAQARRFAAMLNDDNGGNNKEALRGLLALDLNPEIQPEISKQLSTAVDRAGFDIDDLLQVIQKWGDKQCLPALHAYLEKEAFLDNHPELFDALNYLDDDSSIPILTGKLVEFASPSKRIADCLIEYGDRATPEVVKLLNHKDKNVQDAVKRFVDAVKVENDVLIDQCLADFKVGEEQNVSNAFKWLSRIDLETAELTDARRNEIASAMGAAVDSGYFTEKENAAKTFCEWATITQAPLLIEMMDAREEHKWAPALEKMVGFNRPDLSARPVAEMLTNFFKREKTIKILRDSGSAVEDLAIALIGGLEDDEALYEACDLLARFGTEKAIMPLNDLTKRASRAGGNDGKKIVAASKEAIQIIKTRLAAGRDDTAGDGN